MRAGSERGKQKQCSLGERLPELFGLARGVSPEVDGTVEKGAEGRVLDLAGVDAVVIEFFFFWRKREVEVEAERNVGGRQRRTSPKGKKGSDGSTRRTREKEWTKLFFAAFHFEFSSVVCSNRRKLVSSCSVARLYSQTKASRPLPWLKMEAITAVERKKNQCFADEVFQLSFLSLLLASLSLT